MGKLFHTILALAAAASFAQNKPIDIENRESKLGRTNEALAFLEPGSYSGYYCSPRSGAQHLDISADWTLTGLDCAVAKPSDIPVGAESILVREPTSVQIAFFKAGKLPDPYVGLNSKLYEPLEKKIWYYKKTFLADNPDRYAVLYFAGADYFSRVWLNGNLLGEHQGANGGPIFEVSKFLKKGENEIVVEIVPAHRGDRKSFNFRRPKNIVKAMATGGGTGTEAFFAFGIWGGVRIEFLPEVHLERPFLSTVKLSENSATLRLKGEVLAGVQSQDAPFHIWTNNILYRGTSELDIRELKDSFELEVSLSDASGTLLKKTFKLSPHEGRNWFDFTFDAANPKLWWPVGLGDANLYDVSVNLIKNGKKTDGVAFKTGIRTITRIPTAGPKALERWDDLHFVINGKEVFIKGANWMLPDLLYNLPDSRYRWLLEMAKDARIQMLRVWGGGPLELDAFYNICAELGILVWQDFTVFHQDVPLRPYNVWEEQVMLNIFRLRNNPAVALYCGGNGFNPMSAGNTQTMGILERSINLFDPTRAFIRSSSDAGNMHNYPDMDPCWYSRVFKYVPFISETGIHSVMGAKNVRLLVAPSELNDLGKMYDKGFDKTHPELMNHFVEYSPSRIPRMLSRSSHIDDVISPTLESIAESSQVAAGEFYQIFSEQTQSNYPYTAGLLPWVFNRSWPIFSSIMIVDGFGQPLAPYYFLKRTYERTHAAVLFPRLIWGSGETIEMRASISHDGAALSELTFTVDVYSDKFEKLASQSKKVGFVAEGTNVVKFGLDGFKIPDGYKDRFLFVEAKLLDKNGVAVSRSVYWPRSLALADNPKFIENLKAFPVPYKREFPWPTLKNGPWLRPILAQAPRAKLEASVSRASDSPFQAFELTIKNTSNVPSFMTQIDLEGTAWKFCAGDNFFWLGAGEEVKIRVNYTPLFEAPKDAPKVFVWSWNADRLELASSK